MMSERIAAAFEAAQCEGRAALMPYMMAGFPGPRQRRGDHRCIRRLRRRSRRARRPVLRSACRRAGNPRGGAARARRRHGLRRRDGPLPPGRRQGRGRADGLCEHRCDARDRSVRDRARAAAGAAGAIVPDLPIEEAAELRAELAARGLALVQVVAPTTPRERLQRICAGARGFVYVVSLTGVTGERAELPAHLAELVGTVRAATKVPVAVGFGIGTPEQAAAVGRIADGVIVGTRLVRAARDGGGPGGAADAVGDFLVEARAAMARAR